MSNGAVNEKQSTLYGREQLIMWKALLLVSLIGFSAFAADAQKVEVSGKLIVEEPSAKK